MIIDDRTPLTQMDWIPIENEGLIDAGQIVAIGRIESAPIRRMVQATPASRVVVLTGGRRRQTVVALASGHVVITSLTVAQLANLLDGR